MTMLTDHKPNTFLSSKPAVQLARRQVHWQEFLSLFYFTWEYIKEKANVADPLSRNPVFLSTMCTVTGRVRPYHHDSISQLKESANHLNDQIKAGLLIRGFSRPRI